MTKNRIALRAVSNVAAGKTALIDLPIGPRYHIIELQHGWASGGTNSALGAAQNILEIRVKVNGRVQRTMSGTQLRDLNLLNGLQYDNIGTAPTTAATPVTMPIFFAEPWRNSPADQDALAWPSFGMTSFQIEVDLGAGVTPTLIASAVTDDFVPSKPAMICKWIRQSVAAAGTAFDIVTVDRRDWLQQISFFPPVAASDNSTLTAFNKITLRANGQILHELTYLANFGLLTHFSMLPTASGRTAAGLLTYDLVLDHDGLLASAVDLSQANSLTLSMEAAVAVAGSATFIVQRIGPPE